MMVIIGKRPTIQRKFFTYITCMYCLLSVKALVFEQTIFSFIKLGVSLLAPIRPCD